MVDRARAYIQEMQERHGMYPNKFHYTELAMVYVVFEALEYLFFSIITLTRNKSTRRLTEILKKYRYGLHYCRNADWRKTIEVFRRLYPDPNSRVGLKVIMIMNQLRKWDQWKALVEFFELLDNGELRKEKKGGIPGNIVRARHLQAAIDAYYEVTKSEADSYKVMMNDLKYNDNPATAD